MSEQQSIPHEAKFLQALGVNPDNVMAESTRLEWKQGTPVLYFVAVHPLDPTFLASALMASSAAQVQTGEDEGPTPIKKTPQDRRTKKAVAKKTTQRGAGGDAAAGDR